MVNVAINGFGRIGRSVLKAGINNKNINFVALNDLGDLKTIAHLLKYDSVYGKFDVPFSIKKNSLFIKNQEIKIVSEKDPKKLPWKKFKVDVVVESTGLFRTKKLASQHLKAGAKKVLLSAPFSGKEYIKTVVLGVNQNTYNKDKDKIITNASCTTNCLAPIVKVLNDKFDVERGFMNTVHAYTGSQRLVDAPHHDLRRARAAAYNIIPTSSGATKAVTETIPSLKGKLDGLAVRVPVIDGSIVDFTATTKKRVTVETVNKAFKQASKTYLKNILEYSTMPLVSSDVIGSTYSCVFDSLGTQVMGNMVKVLGWYDNEWGYSNRMVELIEFMMK